MKAIRIHRFGDPEVLELDEVPVPRPGENELLVRIHAASVNPTDYKIRRGHCPRSRQTCCPSRWAATDPERSRPSDPE
jgi:NADPH:quinone reductase-like Zn-dependent oxidoreductase